MTLIRCIQRASILAGIIFAGIAFHGSSATAQTAQFCVVANNGKTACGPLKAVERACVTTDGNNVVCGKFKSVSEGQAQRQEEVKTSTSIAGYRKEVDNFVLTLESCKRVDENVRCQLNIVNKGKERTVDLLAQDHTGKGSSLVDSTGKSHTATGADFGSGSGLSAQSIITPNNEVVISLAFSKIPDSAVKIQLLNFAFRSGIKPIQFRNVPITN